MEAFNRVLSVVNEVVIGVVAVAFTFQIVYLFLFFLPAKKIPPAQSRHKFILLTCAHNEEDKIATSLRNLRFMHYPKELYKVVVIADNCTDGTAEVARKMGATVYERREEDKKKRNVGWALYTVLPQILEDFPDVEAFIRLDADNVLHSDYVARMNDAFDSGITLARGYNHATNLTQNVVSGVSGLWYIRDCRFNCQARSALGIGQMMVGGGMMFSAELIRGHGWQERGMSEDAEFTMNMLLCGKKAAYVKDAIVYEDQPSSLSDLFKRNYRMGHGLFRLFFTHGLKCFLRFFVSLRYSLFDVFLSMLFMPIALLCVFWFPFYYLYVVIYHFATGGGLHSGCKNCGFFVEFAGMKFNVLEFLGWVLLLAFVIPFIAQAIFVYFLDRKRIGVPFLKLLPTMLAFPVFMIIYALGIALGAVSSVKWKSVRRNRTYDESFIRAIEDATGQPFLCDREEILARE